MAKIILNNRQYFSILVITKHLEVVVAYRLQHMPVCVQRNQK